MFSEHCLGVDTAAGLLNFNVFGILLKKNGNVILL